MYEKPSWPKDRLVLKLTGLAILALLKQVVIKEWLPSVSVPYIRWNILRKMSLCTSPFKPIIFSVRINRLCCTFASLSW